MSKHAGFTLFELLVVLAIIGLLSGLSLSAMPRLMSGHSVQANARRLAGAGLEARQRALLEQRPWELIVDVAENRYHVGPAGAFDRREQGLAPMNPQAPLGVEAGTFTVAREKVAPGFSLKTERDWSVDKAYSHAEDDASLTEGLLDEGVRVVEAAQGDASINESRVRLVFSARGFSAPYTLWLDEEDNEDQRYTVYFPGLLPPEVARDFRRPLANGLLGEPMRANNGWSRP